jgi:hypothetical protein
MRWATCRWTCSPPPASSKLVSERYEKDSIILTSNNSYGDWSSIFADNVIASAILDRLLHHTTTTNINGESYRLKDKKKAGVIAAKTANKEGARPTGIGLGICGSGLRPPPHTPSLIPELNPLRLGNFQATKTREF